MKIPVTKSYINDQTEDGNDRWDNVQELRRLAFDFQEKGLTEFLQNLALVSDQDTIPSADVEDPEQPRGAVTLLTLHAAKGLEYNQVFIIGLDEGLLPHSRSRDDPEEMAEERRLFYVGMTRAKNQLYLLRAERRRTFNMWDYGEASRFLADINTDLVLNQGRHATSRRETYESDFRWSTTGVSTPRQYKVETPKETRYKPGMRVRTNSWGDGVVLESKIDSDGEETVDVHFESVGFKRVLASLANLGNSLANTIETYACLISPHSHPRGLAPDAHLPPRKPYCRPGRMGSRRTRGGAGVRAHLAGILGIAGQRVFC